MTVRAVRMNNPGNIVAGDQWQGLMPRAQMTPDQASEPRFAVFANPKWGFRALGVVLLNYVRVHHLSTINQIIGRWAPPSENDTVSYATAVSRAVGIGVDTPADFTKPDLLTALAKAIAIHETGSWLFSDADLSQGIALAEAS
jgi:predicted transcriptional regulator